MKRLLLFIALAMLLSSCAAPAPPEPVPEPEPAPAPVFAEPTFMLDKLPQLSQYQQQGQIVSRYYDEPWVDELRPATDYGRLYPYVGQVKGNGWWASNSIYGLADEKGRIVVDPVYLYAYSSYDDSDYLILAYPPDTENEEVRRVFEATEGFASRTRYQFASRDGSWVSALYYGDSASLQEGRIIISEYTGNGDYWAGEGQSFRIYNLDGTLINEVQGRFNGFSEGRASVFCKDRYEYIDLDGNTVIPGPFVEAQRFENGRAEVAVKGDGELSLVGVIDMDGNYLVEPAESIGMNYSSYQGNYKTFSRTDAAGERITGLIDKNDNIVVEAKYRWLDLPWEGEPTQAIGTLDLPGDVREYYLIDLKTGTERLIDIGVPLFGVNLSGDWLNVSYENGTALVKGEQVYRFDSPDGGYLNIRQITGDLFALNYERRSETGRTAYSTDIFDAAQGKVVKSVAGWHFSSTLEGGLMVFYLPSAMDRYLVLDTEFAPAFGGQNTFTSISYMEGGLFAARTTLMSGLLTQDGQWLLRVFVNNLD